MNENSVTVCMQYFRDQRERAQPMYHGGYHGSQSSHVYREVQEQRDEAESAREQLEKLKLMAHTIRSGIDEIGSQGAMIRSGPSSTQDGKNSHRMNYRDENEEDGHYQKEMDDLQRDQ